MRDEIVFGFFDIDAKEYSEFKKVVDLLDKLNLYALKAEYDVDSRFTPKNEDDYIESAVNYKYQFIKETGIEPKEILQAIAPIYKDKEE